MASGAAREIGYAVIGLGMGRAHARSASRIDGCKLVAVADLDEKRLAAAAEEYRCETYADYRQMLKRKDIDIVSVCTPSGAHSDVTIDAARAGKHVLCEKPLDVTLARMEAMIAACRQNGVKLGGVFQNRFGPAHQAMREAIATGRLGRLIVANAHVKWYRDQAYYDAGGWRGTWSMDGGGSLMNQSVHTIDLFQWLMGPVKSVFGKSGAFAHRIETEDLGVALVTFQTGALGTIIGTTCAYRGLGTTIEVHGECGSICVSDGKITVWKIKGEREKEEEAEALARFGSEPPKQKDPLFEPVVDMVAAVREGREPSVPGEEAQKAVEIVLAIYESSKTGREVSLPLAR